MAVPIKGLSDVIGIIDETVLRKIVRDNSIVTPSTEHLDYWPAPVVTQIYRKEAGEK